MDLPKLSDTPTRHPDLCLSISTKLIHTLTTILTTNWSPNPGTKTNPLILSVGSGSGLLEAHLLNHLASLSKSPTSTFTIQGVEVRPSTSSSTGAAATLNRYLPEQHAATVRGTWELSPLLEGGAGGTVDTLMFVYPREPGLVDRYLKAAPPESLRLVLWLGPRADWEVFGRCFRDVGGGGGFGGVEVIEGDGVGVAEFEMLAVLRRR
jgi:hypothetical protein